MQKCERTVHTYKHIVIGRYSVKFPGGDGFGIRRVGWVVGFE